ALAGLLYAALDCWNDLVRLGYALAVSAEGLRERRIIAGNIRRPISFRRDFHDREFHRHGEVVEEDREDRYALSYRRFEIHAGEADGRIAPNIDAKLVRAGELGAH